MGVRMFWGELMVILKRRFETVPCRATLNTPFSALCPRILGTRFTNYGLRVSGHTPVEDITKIFRPASKWPNHYSNPVALRSVALRFPGFGRVLQENCTAPPLKGPCGTYNFSSYRGVSRFNLPLGRVPRYRRVSQLHCRLLRYSGATVGPLSPEYVDVSFGVGYGKSMQLPRN